MELSLTGAVSVAVVVILLYWVGAIPGAFASSPVRWTMETPTCLHAGETLPSVQHRFPLGAHVRIEWTASSNIAYFTYGDVALDMVGTSGNATFVSHAYPLVFLPEFDPVEGIPPSCPYVNVTTTASYTI